MNNIIVKPQEETIFITEYNPIYAKELLIYAYEHFDIDGYFGEKNILPSVSEKWAMQYEDWRNALELCDKKIKAGLNYNLHALLQFAQGQKRYDPRTKKDVWEREPDIDLFQKTIFKMSDNILKIDKDTGSLKRKGMEAAKKSKAENNANVDVDLATQIANMLVNNKDD